MCIGMRSLIHTKRQTNEQFQLIKLQIETNRMKQCQLPTFSHIYAISLIYTLTLFVSKL